MAIGTSVRADYVYDGQSRLASRVTQNQVGAGTVRYVHDNENRIIAELNATGTTIREYVWLEDIPVAVLDGSTNTANPSLFFVHADHLNRPVAMSNAARSWVWRAQYEPFGAVHQIVGPAANDNRFPGQMFQLEAGLAYNWHRHYDATLGRYTQADPLGLTAMLSDGPSVYGYARQSPLMKTDWDGLDVDVCMYPNAASGAGHVGFSTPGESGTSGFYPRGNPLVSPGKVEPDSGQSVRNCKTIPATPQQDACMLQCRNNRAQNPGTYNLVTRQCTGMVRDCLRDCGLPHGNNAGAFPGSFFDAIPVSPRPAEMNPLWNGKK